MNKLLNIQTIIVKCIVLRLKAMRIQFFSNKQNICKGRKKTMNLVRSHLFILYPANTYTLKKFTRLKFDEKILLEATGYYIAG